MRNSDSVNSVNAKSAVKYANVLYIIYTWNKPLFVYRIIIEFLTNRKTTILLLNNALSHPTQSVLKTEYVNMFSPFHRNRSCATNGSTHHWSNEMMRYRKNLMQENIDLVTVWKSWNIKDKDNLWGRVEKYINKANIFGDNCFRGSRKREIW